MNTHLHVHTHTHTHTHTHAYAYTQVFMRMGLPRVILSDQGREFNNELDTALCLLLGIQHRLSTPYHPQVYHLFLVLVFTLSDSLQILTGLTSVLFYFQTNGLDERFNQTLQNMLVKFVSREKNGVVTWTHVSLLTIHLAILQQSSPLLSSCSIAKPVFLLM